MTNQNHKQIRKQFREQYASFRQLQFPIIDVAEPVSDQLKNATDDLPWCLDELMYCLDQLDRKGWIYDRAYWYRKGLIEAAQLSERIRTSPDDISSPIKQKALSYIQQMNEVIIAAKRLIEG